MFTHIPQITKNLLIINIICFLAQMVLPFGSELTSALALHYWQSDAFRPYQLITYMFMHGNLHHLFFNMFALWMFGRVAEYDLGSKRFFIFYFVTGVGAGLLNLCVMELEYIGIKNAVAEFIDNPNAKDLSILHSEYLRNIKQEYIDSVVSAWEADPSNPAYVSDVISVVKLALSRILDTQTVGASGAIFGILLAFGLMHPNDRIMLLIPPIPMKAKYFVMGYGAIELIMGLSNSGGSVAHFAHLGGMLWAWLLLYYWKKKGYIYY